jgi:hypothetical protein
VHRPNGRVESNVNSLFLSWRYSMGLYDASYSHHGLAMWSKVGPLYNGVSIQWTGEPKMWCPSGWTGHDRCTPSGGMTIISGLFKVHCDSRHGLLDGWSGSQYGHFAFLGLGLQNGQSAWFLFIYLLLGPLSPSIRDTEKPYTCFFFQSAMAALMASSARTEQ